MHRWTKIVLMLVTDLVAMPLCFLMAMALRLGDMSATLSYGIAPYIAVGLITVAVFVLCGLYRAVIRFIDQTLLRSNGIGLGLAIVAAYMISFLWQAQNLPRSALTIYWFIAFSYVVGSRLAVRAFLRKYSVRGLQHKNLIAIYGAGKTGTRLAQAIRLGDKYRVVCFFDDKVSLSYHNVAGLKVFHASRMAELAREAGIRLLVLAIPNATAERRRQIMHEGHEAGMEVKTLRSLVELADDSNISTRSIREIRLEDLLGREPVPPQIDLFSRCVKGKNVLVTGAGGSIGSELCRQIMAQLPNALYLLDHSEFALYTIEQELRTRFPDVEIHSCLGSVCDVRTVERIMDAGIDTVYHAAAYKHVPLVEANMAEGIRNNVIGAQVIVTAAEKYRVHTCVLVSSDKAVRPTNIMGASKRIAELIFQAAAQRPDTLTTFCMVRFGNVLGSSGSVVPLFQKQIEEGGPITITHPEIVRYFMLIPEAAQLVIQAGAMAKGGEVFVLDMGEPIKIVDLARTMIDMAGLEEKNAENPDGDIEIRYVGLRPGEKLYEELLIGNAAEGSEHPRIMRTTEYSFEPEVLERFMKELMQACDVADDGAIRAAMGKVVLEYAPQKLDAQPETLRQTAELTDLEYKIRA